MFDLGTAFGTRRPEKDSDLDYALIRIDEPILGVEPIPIATDAKSLKKNQEMLVVSAHQGRMKKGRKVMPNEPVIQSCEAKDITVSQNNRGMVVLSDCSSSKGASGSIILMRDESSRLVGIGIHARGGGEQYDGKDFDISGGDGNYGVELMFDGPLAADLRRNQELKTGI